VSAREAPLRDPSARGLALDDLDFDPLSIAANETMSEVDALGCSSALPDEVALPLGFITISPKLWLNGKLPHPHRYSGFANVPRMRFVEQRRPSGARRLYKRGNRRPGIARPKDWGRKRRGLRHG
jgi:hypothetical protein